MAWACLGETQELLPPNSDPILVSMVIQTRVMVNKALEGNHSMVAGRLKATAILVALLKAVAVDDQVTARKALQAVDGRSLFA